MAVTTSPVSHERSVIDLAVLREIERRVLWLRQSLDRTSTHFTDSL